MTKLHLKETWFRSPSRLQLAEGERKLAEEAGALELFHAKRQLETRRSAYAPVQLRATMPVSLE